MKKIILTIGISILSTVLMAGNDKSAKIYSQLKDGDETFSMSLSKTMVDFFDLDLDLNGKERWITGDFNSGKLLVLKNKHSGEGIKKMFLKEGFELIDVEEENDKDEDGEVYLLVSRDRKVIREAHFIAAEDEKVVLFSVFGKIKVSKK